MTEPIATIPLPKPLPDQIAYLRRLAEWERESNRPEVVVIRRPR